MDLNALRALGEWMALGFYEAADEPWPVPYGRAFLRLYENMEIVIPEDRLLVPCEPLPRARNMATHGLWYATSLICDFNHHCGLRLNREIAEEKKEKFPQYSGFIDALARDLSTRLEHFGGYTHSNPDIRRVVGEGFLAMEAELDRELEAVRAEGTNADPGEVNPLRALKEYACGVRAFHARAAAALKDAAEAAEGDRGKELSLIAASFARAFMNPSKTFVEGLLAANFSWLLDGCDSIGRFDQALGDLFERDIKSGALEVAFARRLLDEFWQNFERFNGWNLQIGGYTSDGRDGLNALTIECIAACGRNRIRRPNVAFRITPETPETALVEALKVLREGSGRPALYNDERYVKTLYGIELGLTEEDAREVGFGGCTETMIPGLSNVGSLEGTINLAKALELALNDGFDPVEGKQSGPHTGSFAAMRSFEDLMGAVKRQIQYMTDAFVARNSEQLKLRFTRGDPKLYRTFFTRDCVRKRRSFEAGGARYNWAVVTYQGIANLIDGLSAVKKFVYEEKTVSPAELLAALAADFNGCEHIRRLLATAPRYGNGDAYADEIGREVVTFAWETLYAHETPRGGRYLPSCILFATYAGAGKLVGATPDGRKAGEVLTDSVGPAQGRDTRGPTAMLNSACRLPLALAAGTPVLNLRFQKSVMRTERDLEKIAALIRTFFARGGMQLQISVLSREEMLAAQKEPEKHAELIVRIGGYSEYFTRLDRALQDSVIARTEHGL